MKLWEAPLSSSALADTAPIETCSCSNLRAKGTKISGAESLKKKAKKIYLNLYATVVSKLSFWEKSGVLEVGWVCRSHLV